MSVLNKLGELVVPRFIQNDAGFSIRLEQEEHSRCASLVYGRA